VTFSGLIKKGDRREGAAVKKMQLSVKRAEGKRQKLSKRSHRNRMEKLGKLGRESLLLVAEGRKGAGGRS